MRAVAAVNPEHYQHRHLDHIAAFLAHLVNWDFVNQTLLESKRCEIGSSAA